MPAQLEDPDEHDNKPVRALDEDDIALLKTYVRHPRLPQSWPMILRWCCYSHQARVPVPVGIDG